jgi:prepilin-type N-terminal cleavage/methylation domain-containing protein
MNILKRNINGFTLIELMILVAIFGILASVIAPSYEKYLERKELEDHRLNTILYKQENCLQSSKALSVIDHSLSDELYTVLLSNENTIKMSHEEFPVQKNVCLSWTKKDGSHSNKPFILNDSTS